MPDPDQEREVLLREAAQELADATDVLVPPFEPSDPKLRRILGARANVRANVRAALAAREEPQRSDVCGVGGCMRVPGHDGTHSIEDGW